MIVAKAWNPFIGTIGPLTLWASVVDLHFSLCRDAVAAAEQWGNSNPIGFQEQALEEVTQNSLAWEIKEGEDGVPVIGIQVYPPKIE